MNRVTKRSPEAEAWTNEILRIGNEAIRKTREENRRLGLPNVGERDGQTILEMPDGTEVVVGTPRKRKPEAA